MAIANQVKCVERQFLGRAGGECEAKCDCHKEDHRTHPKDCLLWRLAVPRYELALGHLKQRAVELVNLSLYDHPPLHVPGVMALEPPSELREQQRGQNGECERKGCERPIRLSRPRSHPHPIAMWERDCAGQQYAPDDGMTASTCDRSESMWWMGGGGGDKRQHWIRHSAHQTPTTNAHTSYSLPHRQRTTPHGSQYHVHSVCCCRAWHSDKGEGRGEGGDPKHTNGGFDRVTSVEYCGNDVVRV